MINTSKLTKFKKIFIPVILILIVIVAVYGGYTTFFGNKTSIASTSRPDLKTQKIDLNKTFNLNVGSKDASENLTITFQVAQLINKVTVAGKSKYSPKGTTYLMINFLIENPTKKRLQFRTRDTVRLIDTSNKKFAPSQYNKDLVIDGDSVKKDTVGWLVPDNIKDFKIQYGSLQDTDKQILELKFK